MHYFGIQIIYGENNNSTDYVPLRLRHDLTLRHGDLMAEVEQVQAVLDMVDSIIVNLFLIGLPAPRLSGASLLESLDDYEVDPFQVLSLARERHRQSVDVMEIWQRAVGRPWDGEARALRCLPVHPYDKIPH